MIDLRLGRYQEALADVDCVDAVICDPPYSARTHRGSDAAVDRSNDSADRHLLEYEAWEPGDVRVFMDLWGARCTGWIVALTDDELAPSWRRAAAACGRYDFAPVPIIQDKPRLGGDGPASSAVYLMASRPRERRFLSWGSLPGWYKSVPARGTGVMGAKPLDLMRALVRDYSRPGDLVCDPCAGGGTTLAAAKLEGRRAIGAEMDPRTHALAAARLAEMPGERADGQTALFVGEP